MAIVALSDDWVTALVEASAAVEAPGHRSAVIEFAIGKTKRAGVRVEQGRVTGPSGEDEPVLSVPVTAAQLGSYCDGSASMSTDYMRGDFKPVGPTSAILALLALFDDPGFVAELSRRLAD